MWWRARMLGGRTNHYGRISLRMGPYDFKPYSRDGKGFDWPITYDDLAPYYDKAEQVIGVFGTRRAWRTPQTASSCRRPRRAATSGSSRLALRQAEDPLHSRRPRHPHAADPWPCGLPLLRAVRPGVRVTPTSIRPASTSFPR